MNASDLRIWRGRVPAGGAERGGNRHGQHRDGEDREKIQRHDALDPAAQKFRRGQIRTVRRIENDEAGNDEKQIDAPAAVGKDKGDRALRNLEARGGNPQRMKGDDGKGCEKPENLDMDEHPSSFTAFSSEVGTGSRKENAQK